MTITVIDRTGDKPFARALEDEEFELIAGPWRDLPADVLDAMERVYWESVDAAQIGPDFVDEKDLVEASPI